MLFHEYAKQVAEKAAERRRAILQFEFPRKRDTGLIFSGLLETDESQTQICRILFQDGGAAVVGFERDAAKLCRKFTADGVATVDLPFNQAVALHVGMLPTNNIRLMKVFPDMPVPQTLEMPARQNHGTNHAAVTVMVLSPPSFPASGPGNPARPSAPAFRATRRPAPVAFRDTHESPAGPSGHAGRASKRKVPDQSAPRALLERALPAGPKGHAGRTDKHKAPEKHKPPAKRKAHAKRARLKSPTRPEAPHRRLPQFKTFVKAVKERTEEQRQLLFFECLSGEQLPNRTLHHGILETYKEGTRISRIHCHECGVGFQRDILVKRARTCKKFTAQGADNVDMSFDRAFLEHCGRGSSKNIGEINVFPDRPVPQAFKMPACSNQGTTHATDTNRSRAPKPPCVPASGHNAQPSAQAASSVASGLCPEGPSGHAGWLRKGKAPAQVDASCSKRIAVHNGQSSRMCSRENSLWQQFPSSGKEAIQDAEDTSSSEQGRDACVSNTTGDWRVESVWKRSHGSPSHRQRASGLERTSSELPYLAPAVNTSCGQVGLEDTAKALPAGSSGKTSLKLPNHASAVQLPGGQKVVQDTAGEESTSPDTLQAANSLGGMVDIAKPRGTSPSPPPKQCIGRVSYLALEQCDHQQDREKEDQHQQLRLPSQEQQQHPSTQEKRQQDDATREGNTSKDPDNAGELTPLVPLEHLLGEAHRITCERIQLWFKEDPIVERPEQLRDWLVAMCEKFGEFSDDEVADFMAKTCPALRSCQTETAGLSDILMCIFDLNGLLYSKHDTRKAQAIAKVLRHFHTHYLFDI